MVDTDQKLADLLPGLRAAEWIALDTEADSLHAYPEKLCLIQLSFGQSDELLDPLAAVDFRPLLESLRGRELILHGADYDLRLLRRALDFVPAAVFDTMLAARLLGFAEFGLTNLVARLLDVQLGKGAQKLDWARRPLTERMAAYARNDTHYLKPIADRLRAQLDEKSRLAWHHEICARLVEECARPVEIDPDEVWRLKGASKLDRLGLATLRELWKWREQEATAANKPPFFVLSHDTLITIAHAVSREKSVSAHLPPRISPRRREGVQAAVARARELAPSEWPHPKRHVHRRPAPEEKHRFEDLRRKRDRRAAELGLDPSLIASRSTLGLLAWDWDANQHELMRWQLELLQRSG